MKGKIKLGVEFWSLLALLLALPAFLINLGLMPFIEDESIRAIIALEMRLRDNYIVPLYNDTLYNAKPPLWNWILNLSYSIFGFINEWSSRFPTVLSTFFMSYLVYKCALPYFNQKRYALFAGFFFLTCGRILFWDSFLGLIDITYSMVVFLIFILTYKLGSSKNTSRLYLSIYALATVAFFFKGLPIFVFLGATFLAFLIVHGRWRTLVHPAHFVGLFGFLSILGFYYYLYGLYSDDTLGNLSGLAQQSTMRTPLAFEIEEVLLHLITYPFEFIYHYLPWTLFVVLLFRKGAIQMIRKHSFFYYSSICFLLNILVYWISPQVYARYVLMLVPLFYYVLLFAYQEEEASSEDSWRLKTLRYAMIVLISAIPVFMFFSFNTDRVLNLDGGQAFLAIFLLLVLFLVYLYYKNKGSRPMILVVILLCLRIGFDLIVLPTRTLNDYGTFAKYYAIELAKKYPSEDIALYKDSKVDFTGSFYFVNTRQKRLIKEFNSLKASTIYIVDTSRYELPLNTMVVDSFKQRDKRMTHFMVKTK
jgi:4-amino-4-deoxy-L-arabinose transferase-like glycosyltransferase